MATHAEIPYGNLVEVDGVPSNNSETQAENAVDPNLITVKIRKLDASEIVVTVSKDGTVLDLKNSIELARPQEHPANLQRLICHGRELADSQLLKSCNIEDNSVVHLVMRQYVPEVRPPEGGQNAAGHAVFNISDPPNLNNNGLEISSFYVSRLCRVIRSFSLINGFFFVIVTILQQEPIVLIAVAGCAFGYYGARYLKKCYLYAYVAWLTIEIIVRVFVMNSGSILLWFFAMIMIVLDFYMMRCVLILNRIISVLPARQIQEVLDINEQSRSYI